MLSRFRLLGLAGLVLVAGACGSGGKQWYKPNADYTVAEFERDRRACTKDSKLDEPCLRERGWVSLSGDSPVRDPHNQPEQQRLRIR